MDLGIGIWFYFSMFTFNYLLHSMYFNCNRFNAYQTLHCNALTLFLFICGPYHPAFALETLIGDSCIIEITWWLTLKIKGMDDYFYSVSRPHNPKVAPKTEEKNRRMSWVSNSIGMNERPRIMETWQKSAGWTMKWSLSKWSWHSCPRWRPVRACLLQIG